MLWKAVVTQWKIIVFALLIVGVVVLGALVDRYRDNAITYKDQRDKATEKLGLANATIKDMQTRQRDAAALDQKYTKELADAKRTNDDLQRDVVAGKRRLQINATCKSNATGPGSVVNAATPTVTADAERDYWRLRSGIDTVTAQVKYLQDYIRQQCLSE